MSKVRILFLGTPDFAVTSLQRLIEDEHFEVVAVVTQPDRPAGRKMQLTPSPVKTCALQAGLKVFSPETVNTEEFRQQVLALGAESAAVVAFGQILGQKFLDLFPRGCVNVHGSLLPRWRGAAPIQRALMAGDQESGVTLQKIVRKLDAGDLLGWRRVELSNEINALDLYEKLKVLGADLLHVEYMDYLRGHLVPVPQDESLVTHAEKIEKSEARLDWSLPAVQIFNRVRGLQLGPYAWTEYQGQALKIHKTSVRELGGWRGTQPQVGEVVSVEAQCFSVACGQGLLDVWEVQPESRSRMPVTNYLRGYGLKIGDVLS
jgi:methionyl-tRNA formyltransferase